MGDGVDEGMEEGGRTSFHARNERIHDGWLGGRLVRYASIYLSMLTACLTA